MSTVVAYELPGEGQVWLIGAVVLICDAAPRWLEMDFRIMCRGIISSCQSAATSEIVKPCSS